MAYQAGTAFIKIVPSFKGFQLAAATEAKKLRPIAVPIIADTKPFEESIDRETKKPRNPLKVKAELDEGSFERNVKAKIEGAIKSLPKKIGLDVQATDAERAIASLRTQLEMLHKQRIGVDVSAEQALTDLSAIQAELHHLGSESPNIQVKADALGASAQLEAVKKMAEDIGAQHPNLKVEADTAVAESKLDRLKAKAAGMNGSIGIGGLIAAAVPVAGPAIAAGGAGLAAVAGLGAGLAAGIGGGAAIGIASVKRAEDLSKQIIAINGSRMSSMAAVRSAENGLQSAMIASANAQVSAARSVADAERGVADARRSAAQAAQMSARAIAAAQEQVVAAQKQVLISMDALHKARLQAQRDLEDMRARQAGDANGVEGASLNLLDAQKQYAALQRAGITDSETMRKARLAVADAELAVANAKRQQTRDTVDLKKAEKAGINGAPGVKSAQQQLDASKKSQADAIRALKYAQQDAATSAANNARSIAVAEQNLARARVDAAGSVAAANRQVALAQQQVATAMKAMAVEEKKRATLLAQMTPMQVKLVAGIHALSLAWGAFLRSVERPVDLAILKGVTAVRKALPTLTPFVKPVAAAFGSSFTMFGNAASSKGAKDFAATLGVFSGKLIHDAALGTLNLAHAFGNLFKAFMPMSSGLSSGLVTLTKRFANWTDSLSKSKGFRSFMDYVHRVGPIIGGIIVDLVRSLGKILTVLAPLGLLELKGIRAFLGFLADMKPATLAAVAVGLGAIGLAVAFMTGGVSLIVPSLVALGGGLAYLFQTSKPLNGALSGLTSWFKDHLLPAFQDAGKKVLPALQSAFHSITDAIHRNQGAFTAIGDFITHVWIPVIAKVYSFVLPLLGRGIGLVIDIFGRFIRLLQDSAPTFRWLWHNVVAPVFNGIGWVIKTVWQKVIRPIFGDMADGVKGLEKVFQQVVIGLGQIWSGLKDAFAEPVNWIIKNVINKLIDAINSVSGLLGIGQKYSHLSTIGGSTGGSKPVSHHPGGGTSSGGGHVKTHTSAANGAVLPGWTPGRDVHHFVSPTAGSLHLSGGEAIMVPEWTAAVGGPAAVARMNRAARRGRGGVSGPDGFSNGGLFKPTNGPITQGLHDQWTGFPAIDFGVPVGTPVYAGADGRVVKSMDLTTSYGRWIQILSNGFSTLYAHLSQRGVGVGQAVKGGQLIGLSGNTGNSTGPHLHFGAQGIDPRAFLGGGQGHGGSLGALLSGIAGAVLDPAGLIRGKIDAIRKAAKGAPGGPFGLNTAVGIAEKYGQAAIEWAGKQALTLGGNVGLSGSASSAKDYARNALAGFGWGPDQFGPLDSLWMRESGWDKHATNKSSGAYGIPQSLPASKMASAGLDWRDNAATQIKWGLGYIKGRYGSPAGAWAHELSNGWYSNGGTLPTYDNGGYLPPGVSMVYNGTRKPEPILTASQWADIKAAGGAGGNPGAGHTFNVYDNSGSPSQTAAEVARRLAFA